MPFAATWMELETFILSEMSQKDKDKYHMISLISGIYYMAQMNLFTENKSVCSVKGNVKRRRRQAT